METYYGHIRTPADAIILFEACRIGLLPRVQRRLSEKERQSIRSGSVFVWDEREAGMRRWTDGKSWSASRVSGSFLTYREMEGKRGGGSVLHPVAGKTPDSTRGSDDDRSVDDGPDGYRYKPDGLMKQSFSITTSSSQHLHLISYYSRAHPMGLPQPSTDPALRHVRPQKGLYPESTVNDQQNLPVVTRGPMPGAAYPITPHPMGGYAPTYAWPLSPLPTPPSVPMHYGPSYLPPLSNGQAQYAHHSVHQPLPPPPPPPGGVPQSHDRPYPRETAGAPALPPPPAAALPPPVGGYLNRPPRGSEVQSPYQQSPPGYGAAPSSDPSRTSGSARTQNHYFQQQTNGASPGMHSPHDRQHGASLYHHNYSQPPPPPSHSQQQGQQQPHPSDAPKPRTSGSTVPSIGALMSGAPSSTGSGAGGLGGGGGGRTTTGSPRTGDGPQDIPSNKIAFGGEDIRALRQLDRVFTA